MAEDTGPLAPLALVALETSWHRERFETLAARHLEGYPDLLAAVDGARSSAAAAGGSGIDSAYNRDVVPAIDATAAHADSLATSPTDAILDAASSGDQVRQSVLKYLPGVDAPIDIAFVPDPPGPPGQPPPGPTPPEEKD